MRIPQIWSVPQFVQIGQVAMRPPEVPVTAMERAVTEGCGRSRFFRTSTVNAGSLWNYWIRFFDSQTGHFVQSDVTAVNCRPKFILLLFQSLLFYFFNLDHEFGTQLGLFLTHWVTLLISFAVCNLLKVKFGP